MKNMVYDDNWDENNIKNIREQLGNEEVKPAAYVSISNHGTGDKLHISKESRKISAESLLE